MLALLLDEVCFSVFSPHSYLLEKFGSEIVFQTVQELKYECYHGVPSADVVVCEILGLSRSCLLLYLVNRRRNNASSCD